MTIGESLIEKCVLQVAKILLDILYDETISKKLSIPLEIVKKLCKSK